MTRWTLFALLSAVGLVGLHLVLSFTLNINGDEFALLERAIRTVRTGEVAGGGRAGLGTLSLIPLIRDCVDAVQFAVRARLAWTLWVVGGVAGFVVLLRELLPAEPRRTTVIVTATGLWILAPAFLQTSVQVRTDQPAIFFGLWCGVALLVSQRRAFWALVAGLSFGTGFLFNQKAAYVGALVGVLVLGKLLMDREFEARREFTRAGLLVVGSLLAVGLYRILVSDGGGTPDVVGLASNMASRDYYRELFGFRLFRHMLPTLLAQVVAVGCVVIVSLDWIKDRGRHGARILTAWGVVAVGVAVFLFHTTRVPYFYMVIGLFPAAAGALVIGPTLERLQSSRERRALLGVLWGPMIITVVATTPGLLEDTQRPQRDTLAFVERNFPPGAHGFEAFGLFMCREDPAPIASIGFRSAAARFSGPDSLQQAQRFIDRFRSKPVSFLVRPNVNHPFPAEAWSFWQSRYQHYSHDVYVPGAELRSGRTERSFEALVSGTYRWYSPDASPLLVGGRRVEPDEAVTLDAGVHELRLPEGGTGRLLLDLTDPPTGFPDMLLYQPWDSPAADADREERG